MPETELFVQATAAAAITTAAVMVLLLLCRRTSSNGSPRATWLNMACATGIGCGLATGFYLLSLPSALPPINALDRLVIIVLPSACCIEWIGGLRQVSSAVGWLLRLGLFVSIPRILLHSSVYLSGNDEWTFWQGRLVITLCVLLLALVWFLLSRLSMRSPGVTIPLAIGVATQCAGVTIMMAGYINGGAAAFPLAAAVVVSTIISSITERRVASTGIVSPSHLQAVLGIGVVGLFGVLFVGHFFGRLSTTATLAMLLAPLLCWVSEVPALRRQSPWLIGTLRMTVVAIPLLFVLASGKRDFDREMSPLLEHSSTAIEMIALQSVHRWQRLAIVDQSAFSFR
jgi:hypothetical protein